MFLHIGGNKCVPIKDIILIKREDDNSSTIILDNGEGTQVLKTSLTVNTLKKRMVKF